VAEKTIKPLVFIASSKRALSAMPEQVKDAIGHALYEAQQGLKPFDAKVMRGFDGASVLEVVCDHAGNTYRAVYTVKFADAVYVLHVFQKKSKKGAKTPKSDIDLVDTRLDTAEKLAKEKKR
jgi:phage-related protein